MALDVWAALREGVHRTVAPSGRLLLGAFLLVGLASALTTQTLNRAAFVAASRLADAPSLPDPAVTVLALPVSLPVAITLALFVAVVAEAVRIVAIRALFQDDVESIPVDATGSLGWATANGFFGGILVTILVGVGFLLLIVPGVFLAISFFFVRQEIAVEGKNVVDAMAGSWNLARGNRVELVGLALIVLGANIVGAIPTLAATLVGPIASTAVAPLVGAVTTVFSIAVGTRAYAQLQAERTERLGGIEVASSRDA